MGLDRRNGNIREALRKTLITTQQDFSCGPGKNRVKLYQPRTTKLMSTVEHFQTDGFMMK